MLCCCVPFLLLLLGTVSDACMRSKAVVRLNCPRNRYKTAESRATSAMVAWDRQDFSVEATRPIKGIYQIVPIYGATVTVNRAFYEGTHFIEYKAVDDGGNFDSCSFTVTVNVIRCPDLQNPQFGQLTCDAVNLYGSICTVSCIPGYSIVGHPRVSCTADGQWSDDIPFCRTTTCPDPGTPLHGTRLCTTATHAYGSICTFSCSHGYQLIGNSQLICRANGDRTDWSTHTPLCREITPPTLELCPKDEEVTTSTARTEIEKPRVIFRAEDGREMAHTCTHFGERQFYNFTLGSHVIRCKAFNPMFGEDASSVCQFTLTVKPNPCRPLIQPLNGFLLCSLAQGGGNSLTDTTCRLFCNQGYALPRSDGPQTDVFECDHTGTWQPTHYVPSCVRPMRPMELKLPAEIYYRSSDCRGDVGLNDVRVTFQSAVQATVRMQHACAMNPGSCIVEDVTISCSRDSNRKRRRRRRRYLVSRRHRLRALRTRTHKRSVTNDGFVVPIQFHFATRVPETGGRWPDEYHSASSRLYGMFDFFERHVLDGTFTIAQRIRSPQIAVDKDSLAYAPLKAICDIGYQFNSKIKLCVGCGAGTYYNLDRDRCIQCSAGTYQNEAAQFLCKPCPHGTASVEPGAMNVSQCIDVNECESSPCLNGGRCLNGHASYRCACLPGSTGTHCERRVYDCASHSCQNGGQCVPAGERTYTCRCRASYSGTYCQYQTVDGAWAEWGQWSACSRSCAGGSTQRTRTCNSPDPKQPGKACKEGDDVETKTCNTHDCPACKRLRRPYQGSLHCEDLPDQDLRSCVISCPDGYGFTTPVFSEYTCGRNTSYMWPHESPDNPRCVLPACTKITESEMAHFEFRASFPVQCDTQQVASAVRAELVARAAKATKDLACLLNGKCVLLDPAIQGCKEDKSRQRRHVVGNDSIEVVLELTYQGEMMTDQGIAPSFRETSAQLTELGDWLQNETDHAALFIRVLDNDVTMEPGSGRISKRLECPTGAAMTPDGDHCVDCSPGAFFSGVEDACVLCDTGTYQPLPAQLTCMACPEGFTTYGRGAIYGLECYMNGTEPPELPYDSLEDEFDNADNTDKILIGSLVGTIFVILMTAAALTFHFMKHRCDEKYKAVQREKKCNNKPPEEISLEPISTAVPT